MNIHQIHDANYRHAVNTAAWKAIEAEITPKITAEMETLAKRATYLARSLVARHTDELCAQRRPSITFLPRGVILADVPEVKVSHSAPLIRTFKE